MAVLGTIQPRTLCRGVPLPDEISGQAGIRSRSRQGQARLRGAGADGASTRDDEVLCRRTHFARGCVAAGLYPPRARGRVSPRRLCRRAALDRRDRTFARPGAGVLRLAGIPMTAISSVTIRRARRDDVGVIVAMLASV